MSSISKKVPTAQWVQGCRTREPQEPCHRKEGINAGDAHATACAWKVEACARARGREEEEREEVKKVRE